MDSAPPDLPVPDPLPEAIAAGVFGEFDPLEIDEQAIRSLMHEQANELTHYLSDLQWLRHCWDEGRYPHSGRRPRDTSQLESLRQTIGESLLETRQRYEDCRAAYEEGVGEEAAGELDRDVR